MSKVLVERQITKPMNVEKEKWKKVGMQGNLLGWRGAGLWVLFAWDRLPGLVCKINAVQRLDEKVSSRSGPAVACRQRQLKECWHELLVPRDVGGVSGTATTN